MAAETFRSPPASIAAAAAAIRRSRQPRNIATRSPAKAPTGTATRVAKTSWRRKMPTVVWSSDCGTAVRSAPRPAPGMNSETATTVASSSSKLARYRWPSSAVATASALSGIDWTVVRRERSGLTSAPSASNRNRLSSCSSATLAKCLRELAFGEELAQALRGDRAVLLPLLGHLPQRALQPLVRERRSDADGGGHAVPERQHVGALSKGAFSSLREDERSSQRGEACDDGKGQRKPPAEADSKAWHAPSLGRFGRRAPRACGNRASIVRFVARSPTKVPAESGYEDANGHQQQGCVASREGRRDPCRAPWRRW